MAAREDAQPTVEAHSSQPALIGDHLDEVAQLEAEADHREDEPEDCREFLNKHPASDLVAMPGDRLAAEDQVSLVSQDGDPTHQVSLAFVSALQLLVLVDTRRVSEHPR